MNAKLTDSGTDIRHNFKVEHEGKTYDVVIWTDADSNKFLDEEITLNDMALEREGEEGEICEAIIDYLDKNWETLVK